MEDLPAIRQIYLCLYYLVVLICTLVPEFTGFDRLGLTLFATVLLCLSVTTEHNSFRRGFMRILTEMLQNISILVNIYCQLYFLLIRLEYSIIDY